MNGQARIHSDVLIWKKHTRKELNTAISQKLKGIHQSPTRFPRVKLSSISKAITKRRLERARSFIALLVSEPRMDGT